MNFGINGKLAVITGRAKGIGKAIAKALAEEKCSVILLDVDQQELEQTKEEILKAGGKAISYIMDISKRDEVFHTFQLLEEKYGQIEILINNAGIVRQMDTSKLTDEEFDIVYNINFRGALYCCQSVMEGMRQNGWGRIVNISSLVVKMIGKPNVLSYAASKASLVALTKILAKDLGPDGVTVNGVLPGSIAITDFNDSIGYPKSIKLMTGMNIPVGRRGTPDDIAPAVAFLCSKQAGYITGELLDINGGLLMD